MPVNIFDYEKSVVYIQTTLVLLNLFAEIFKRGKPASSQTSAPSLGPIATSKMFFFFFFAAKFLCCKVVISCVLDNTEIFSFYL